MSDINLAPYPDSNLVPDVFAILDTSQANTSQVNQPTLIIGQMLAAGSYTPGVPVLATSTGVCEAGAGRASMLAAMLRRYRKTDTFGTVWLLPLADNAAGVAATGTIAIAGPAMAAGVLSLYIAGQLVPVTVAAGDAAATIATNLVAAAAQVPTLPVTVAATGANVTVTAVHKGLLGNDIDLRLNYLGQQGGEQIPAGVGVTFTAMANGALNPVLATGLAGLSGKALYDFIAQPYTDATSIAAMTAFLNNVAGRWSWQQQLFGAAWSAIRANLSAAVTFGAGQDDPHLQVMQFYDVPTPCWEVAADYCAVGATWLRANPAQPLNGRAMTSLAPPPQSQFDIGEQNTVLAAGLATAEAGPGNTLQIVRSVTTYTLNSAGSPDNSQQNTERMYTIQFCLRDLRTFLQTLYRNSILVADGTKIPFGSPMTTSQLILQSARARYQTYCKLGLMQNYAAFVANSSAQNAGNGQVKLLLPMTASNQLETIGMLIQLQAA